MRVLSSAFLSPLTPKARAMSRFVTRAGGFSPLGAGAPPMKAISSSRDGTQRLALRRRERRFARAGVFEGFGQGFNFEMGRPQVVVRRPRYK